ncbi:unnamed protein product, partial [Amoebophrya sp. A25]
ESEEQLRELFEIAEKTVFVGLRELLFEHLAPRLADIEHYKSNNQDLQTTGLRNNRKETPGPDVQEPKSNRPRGDPLSAEVREVIEA